MKPDRDRDNIRKASDKNLSENSKPEHRNQQEVNHASRTWEASRNPDSDNDRQGRNVDIDRENQQNEMRGREQQTTPKSTTDELIDRFNRRGEDKNKDRSS